MKVICAGISRTGTKSLSAALRKLGYKVYDFEDHGYHHAAKWIRIFKKGWTINDFREMYKDVDVVIAYPIYMFWEELVEAFPDAKVILTERGVEEWYESALKLFINVWSNRSWLLRYGPYLSKTSREFRDFGDAGSFYFGMKSYRVYSPFMKEKINRSMLFKLYKRHNLVVKQNVPKEKLLIYTPGDGWKSLCNFLDVEIPPFDFPHVNKGGVMMLNLSNQNMATQIQRETMTSIISIIVVVFAIVIFLYMAQ